MALYDVLTSGRYKCRGSDGRFTEPIQFFKVYQVDLVTPADDYFDQLQALAEADAPSECVETVITSSDISIPSYPVGPAGPIPTALPVDGGPTTPGQLVTVYATVACEDQSNGSIIYRTVRVDVLWDATVDEVIEALFEAAEAMVDDNPSAYPCNIIGITVTAPAYFQYLTVA